MKYLGDIYTKKVILYFSEVQNELDFLHFHLLNLKTLYVTLLISQNVFGIFHPLMTISLGHTFFSFKTLWLSLQCLQAFSVAKNSKTKMTLIFVYLFLKVKKKKLSRMCFRMVLFSVLLPTFEWAAHFALSAQASFFIMCLINVSLNLILSFSQEEVSGF